MPHLYRNLTDWLRESLFAPHVDAFMHHLVEAAMPLPPFARTWGA
jgi:hypothetical protein